MHRDYAGEHTHGLLDMACVNKGIFPRVIHNLGETPVMVESQEHRRRLMKERGLVEYEADADSRAWAADAKRNIVVGGRGTKMPGKADGTGNGGGPNKPSKLPIRKP